MEAAACGVHLRHDAGGVVGTEFGGPDATWPGAHGVSSGFERDRLEARGVVRSDWRGNDVEEGAARRTYAQRALHANHVGAEVERIAAFAAEGAGSQ